MTIRFTKHSLEKAYERNISAAECESAYQLGVIIESYLHDTPYPSELRLAYIHSRPLHIVSASDGANVHVITVYEPDQMRWESDFKTRKKL